MKRKFELATTNYWPGYVDALTNVVLNLLFMVAIFSMGVFSLGMQSSRLTEMLAQMSATKSALQTSQADEAPVMQKRVAVQIHVNTNAQPTLPEQGLSMSPVQQTSERVLAQIGFEAESVSISDSAKEVLAPLREALKGAKAKGQHLVVWGAMNLRDPEQRRATYLRVMATRDWLVVEGVDAQLIETRLLPGATNRLSGQNIYVLIDTRTP
jgi:hypothetical protein